MSAKRYFYALHGTHLCSDLLLAGLNTIPKSSPQLQLRIRALSRAACAPEVSTPRPGFRRHAQTGQHALVYVTGGPSSRLTASYSATGDRLELVWWDADSPGLEGLDRILTSYLLGNLIAMALRLSGSLVLHGNAACIGGQTLAWVGDKGAGKSTLSAAMLEAGHPLVTDDQVVLREAVDGWRPAYGVPRIRLWPESLAHGSPMTRSAFHQPLGETIKGWLETKPPLAAVGTPPPPLAALYILEPRCPHLPEARITPLPPGQRLQSLLKHRLARQSLPMTNDQLNTEFSALAKFTSRVPVYSLRLPDRLEALPEVVHQLASRHRTATVINERSQDQFVADNAW